MRSFATSMCIVAAIGGCRGGRSSTAEVQPPSNEGGGIAYGLGWLPAETTVVVRFGPGYGFGSEFLDAHPDAPACAGALVDRVTASYEVRRYITDTPVTVAVGELPRDEAEACVALALSAEVARGDDERLTQVTRGTSSTWIGWTEGLVAWHDDAERVLEILATTERMEPDSRLARLVARLSLDGQGLVTTTDLTSPLFGVASIGFVDEWRRGGTPKRSGRILFERAEYAAAVVARYQRAIARTPTSFGDFFLKQLGLVLRGDEVAMRASSGWNYESFISLADFLLVNTGPS